MSGQSIMDRVVAAKHSIAGQGLAKIVCKATTEELMGPKKKHLDYLLQCTNEPNVSIPQLADLLIERTQQAHWVVVFKGLITIHNLMNYGNERFTQYLASNNCTLNLGSFLDKQGVQGYDMSKFVRKYSTYMNEKAVSYRAMAFDFCKVKRGKDDGLLRTMACEKLLKALPVLQKQLDALLEFDCTPNELTNGVVNACFMLLFKDLIRLFACYNDGIINLLEKYFDMNKKQCKEAFDMYKKFLVRMDRVSEFLKVAENVGIDKGDIPDLAKAPASLIDALEQHLNAMEGKKGVTTPTTKPADFATAIDTISSNSSVQVSDDEMKRILEEEKVKLQELKMGPASWEQHFDQGIDLAVQDQRIEEISKTSPTTSSQNQAANNPFITSQPAATQVDLFGPSAQIPVTNSSGKACDNLLNLTGNPFVESVQSVMVMNSQNTFPTPVWGSTNAAGGSFTSDADFAKVFQNSNSTTTGFDAFGDVLQPVSTQKPKSQAEKAMKGDLDSSLANLAGNLHMDGPASQVKKTHHDWQPKSDMKKTGGSNWAPQPIACNTSWGSGFGPTPMTGPRVGYPAAAPASVPNPVMMTGMGMASQPGMGMAPVMYGAPSMSMGMAPQPQPPITQPKHPSDPFGAL